MGRNSPRKSPRSGLRPPIARKRPNALHLVPLGRLERPANGLGNRCSIHLSYRGSKYLRPSNLSVGNLVGNSL